jgi:DNA-binding NtrC family response regulator
LFRKFTTDFSEKYKVKPIALDEDAKKLLLKFPFPGNIRQLKNLAEQISLLEEERGVDAQTLAKYLPKEQSNLPALFPSGSNSNENDFSERDILYKVLFDMKKDMNELKKLVLESFQSGGFNPSVLNKHQNLFEDLESSISFEESSNSSSQANVPLVIESSAHNNERMDDYEDDDIEDIIHEEDDNSLSLEKKEKELILRALKKHNNKRKHAANDLGISERTLYRKIKQYDIE